MKASQREIAMIRIRGDRACFWAVMGAHWAEQQLDLPSGPEARPQAGNNAESRLRKSPLGMPPRSSP